MSPWLSDLFLGSQPDERLVELARKGNDRAFSTIVERYRPRLNAFARRLDAERADDIVQQSLLIAFAALRSGTEVTHLSGWLHRIVRNTAIRVSTKAPTDLQLDTELAGTSDVEGTVHRRMVAIKALAEIAKLPIRQRDAIVATAINGDSSAEVASSMGLSEGAVRQLVHRARATLRTAVTSVLPYPLLRWLGATRPAPDGNRVADLAAGASAAAGGVAVKLSAVVASGVVASGLAVLPHALQPTRHSSSAQHHAVVSNQASAGVLSHSAGTVGVAPAGVQASSQAAGAAGIAAPSRFVAPAVGNSTLSTKGASHPGQSGHESVGSTGGSSPPSSGPSPGDGAGSSDGSGSDGAGNTIANPSGMTAGGGSGSDGATSVSGSGPPNDSSATTSLSGSGSTVSTSGSGSSSHDGSRPDDGSGGKTPDTASTDVTGSGGKNSDLSSTDVSSSDGGSSPHGGLAPSGS